MLGTMFVFIGFIWGAIIIGMLIALPIDRMVKKRATEKADEYFNGLKLRWIGSCVGGLYYKKRNTDIEPVEADILDIFNEYGVKITEYTDTHVIIPWEYITRWRCEIIYDATRPYIIFDIGTEKSITMELSLSATYDTDPAYIAFKKFASEKEEQNSKNRPRNEALAVILMGVYITIIILFVFLAGEF